MPINILGASFMSSQTGDGTTSIHNDLSGLQGGTTDQYYHMDSSSYVKLNGQNQQVKTSSNVSFNQVTSSFNGNGSQITDILASNTIQDVYYFFPEYNKIMTPKGWAGFSASALAIDIGNVDAIYSWDNNYLVWVGAWTDGNDWYDDFLLYQNSYLSIYALTGITWTNSKA